MSGYYSSDGKTDDGSGVLDDSEFYVTQTSDALSSTVELKLETCQKKITVRTKQIYDAIMSNSGAIDSYFRNTYASRYDEWAGTNITITPNPYTDDDISTLSQRAAVELLSTYTVMTEASVSDLRLSDLIKWLGYYNELDSAKVYFTVGGAVECSVTPPAKARGSY